MTPNPYLALAEAALNSVPLTWVLCFLIAAITLVWVTRPMRRPPPPVVPSKAVTVIDHEQG